MSERYLWRKGERELGPFQLEEMRKLVRSGSLGRFQDVSKDGGRSWAHASTFCEIWEPTDLIPISGPPLLDPSLIEQNPVVTDGGTLVAGGSRLRPAAGDGEIGRAHV